MSVTHVCIVIDGVYSFRIDEKKVYSLNGKHFAILDERSCMLTTTKLGS